MDYLGAWKIKCRLPCSEQIVMGCIGPLGLETPEKEIETELQTILPNLESAERIKKGKLKTPTVYFKLTFTGQQLPAEIRLFHQRFQVKHFIDKAWQCYNCLDFRHNARDCKSKPKCASCAGPITPGNALIETKKIRIKSRNVQIARAITLLAMEAALE